MEISCQAAFYYEIISASKLIPTRNANSANSGV